jgi:hypothetical protein
LASALATIVSGELEASIGRLLVVGGRAVSAPPPGALVESPPRRAARGREQDAIFLLITPAGPEQAQAAFYQELARRAAELYFASAGSVTSALRDMITGLNAQLLTGSYGSPYQASLICLVLRGHDCYLARTGICLSAMRQGDFFQTEPNDTRDEHALNGLPLGYSPAPDIKFSHYVAAAGHVLLLSDAGFAAASADDLTRALGMPDLPSALDALKALAAPKTQAMLIRFAVVGTTPPSAPEPANNNKRPAIQPAAPVVLSTPAAAPAPTVISPLLAAMPVATPVATPSPLPPLPPSVIQVSPPPAPAPVVIAAADKVPAMITPVNRPIVSNPIVAPVPIAPAASNPLTPPPFAPDANPPAPDQEAASGPASEVGPATVTLAKPPVDLLSVLFRVLTFPLRAVIAILKGLARLLNAILDRLLPEPEDGSAHISATVAVGAVVLIPVLIVFVMVGLRLTQVDQTNFEKLVSQVQDQANQAAASPPSDPALAQKLWQAVIQRVDDAALQRPGVTDPTLTKIRTQALAALDGYQHVTRRPVTQLRTFGNNASLGAVLVQSSTDIYTLDTNSSAVYRDALRAPLPDVIGTRSTQPIVQVGAAVSNYTVKKIVSMIWMDEGGIRTSHALVGLDPQGILVTYAPTFAPAQAQALSGSERWVSPVAIRTWQDRVYILDPGANQIWRYLPAGTTYPNTPEEYFTSDYQRQLAKAVDFTIDDKGNVYILFADGSLKEYNGGAEQPFTLSNLPDGHLKSANAMILDASSPLPALYILDPVDQSVYEFTVAGMFQARYRAVDPLMFAHLSGIFAQGNNIYVTSGNGLYYFNTGEGAPPKS